jgi:hypothetical protein
VLKIAPGPERVRSQRIRDHLHRLVIDGRKWPVSRRQGIGIVIRMVTMPVTPEMGADWKWDTPEGAEAYRQRNLWLERVCRALLEDWQDDDPDDPTIPRLRSDLDRWAASLTPAVDHAQEHR